MRKPDKTTKHPEGGTITWYTLTNGMHISILDNEYPYADDFEIHQRDEDGNSILFTERRAPTLKAALTILDELETA